MSDRSARGTRVGLADDYWFDDEPLQVPLPVVAAIITTAAVALFTVFSVVSFIAVTVR